MPHEKSPDMMRPETEFRQYPKLRGLLKPCAPIVEEFDRAEEKAFLNQGKYKSNARKTAWYGIAAVLFSLVYLAYAAGSKEAAERKPQSGDGVGAQAPKAEGRPFVGAGWLVFELVLTSAVFAVVTRGLFASHKEHWLLERNRAERCRLLKFRVLTDPSLWTRGRIAAEEEAVQGRLREIQASDERDLWAWAQTEKAPHALEWGDNLIPVDALTELIAYYKTNRLTKQMNYFATTAERQEKTHALKPPLFLFFFYASIVAVLLHTVAEFPGLYNKLWAPVIPGGIVNVMEWTSLVCVVIAVAMPMVSAALRTKHLSFEPARNASRCKAKFSALNELSTRLEEARESGKGGAVLRELSYCEQVLELDQREWMRLMLEAEWY